MLIQPRSFMPGLYRLDLVYEVTNKTKLPWVHVVCSGYFRILAVPISVHLERTGMQLLSVSPSASDDYTICLDPQKYSFDPNIPKWAEVTDVSYFPTFYK